MSTLDVRWDNKIHSQDYILRMSSKKKSEYLTLLYLKDYSGV
jgi:hypothetical protein